jgi:sugar phosphate permease
LSASGSTSSQLPKSDSTHRSGESQVIFSIWFTYGAFYFCRTNLSAALPGIKEELGFDKFEMAGVLFSVKLAYAIGQFVNGQLSERIAPRVMLAIGMFGSALLNILFGFGTAVYFFLFVWATNGAMQSLGWTPCMRVIGNWIPVERRGKAIGIVGTGYQLAASLTFLVSGAAVSYWGWRGAFFVPPAILIAAAGFMLIFLREKPTTESVEVHQETLSDQSESRRSFSENLVITLTNPALWVLAVSLGMLNACRYGYLDWGITHLYEIEKDRLMSEAGGALQAGALDKAVFKQAIKYMVLPIGGIAGSFLAGWTTDRFLGGRRAPVITVLLLMLSGLTLIYAHVDQLPFYATIIVLLLVGFTIYGPQVLLVGTAPADLARQGTTAAAAGFVNSMGYLGAALLGDLLTGYLAEKYGWSVAIHVWAGLAFLAAVLVGTCLWNTTGHAHNKSDTTDKDTESELDTQD